MEELQDAIEDAQYVNAISTVEDGPRPVLPWEIPSEEQLAAWEEKNRREASESEESYEPFGIDWVMSTPIGLFLFSAYLKEICEDYIRINFIEEVLRFKKLRGHARFLKAREIMSSYLKLPESTNEDTGEPMLPKKIEIDEYDLEREKPELRLSSEQLESLYTMNIDPENTVCPIGIKGPVLDEVMAKMSAVEDTMSINKAESMPAIVRESAMRGNGVDPEDATAVFSKSERSDPQTSMRNLTKRLKSDNVGHFPTDLFDKLETVVVESLKRQYWKSYLESEQNTKVKNFLWYGDRPVVEKDFFVMRVLGRGGFGLVNACKKGTSGKLYAMKVMSKKRIKMKKSEQLAVNERLALAAVESNFVVNLKYSFHSKDEVFLILDLMTGGDLGYHLHQKGRFPKKECLYYAARIMLGLQALHDKNYVYRDLKPENCLLADDGRVKITDLGLATKITPTLHGAAGTRGYWAPEMLRRDKKGRRMPYGHTVDWFSFGCCVAEFISGSNPFRSEAALNFGLERGKQTKEKAIDCATLEMDPAFDPEKFESDAADFCRRLLDKNENTRLGTNGCEEIMAHPWFKSVNWESIISDKKSKPPYVPPKDVNAASQSEIGTFAEDKALQGTVIDDKDEEVYKNWDWTNDRAFAAEVLEFLIYERKTGEPLLPMNGHVPCCCSIM